VASKVRVVPDMQISSLFGGGVSDLAQFPAPDRDVPGGAAAAQTAVLAGGCFWCTEAVFLPLDGVESVVSGYIGGSAGTANYEAVCSGTTGHAEAIQITFAPGAISFGQLLRVFFAVAHDPTQLNRQGNDRGTQYRSAIFPVDAEQRAVAAAYIAQLNAAKVFGAPIVTTIEEGTTFYAAETYHQNYAARNPHQPYVAAVAAPKVDKLVKYFGDRLKP
jgi:peptide-methionine (S)-S-oxide reductase